MGQAYILGDSLVTVNTPLYAALPKGVSNLALAEAMEPSGDYSRSPGAGRMLDAYRPYIPLPQSHPIDPSAINDDSFTFEGLLSVIGVAFGATAIGAEAGAAAAEGGAVNDAAIITGTAEAAPAAAAVPGAPALFPLLATPAVAVPELGAADAAAIAQAAGASSSVASLVNATDFIGTLKAAAVGALARLLGDGKAAADAPGASAPSAAPATPQEAGAEDPLPALLVAGLVAYALIR